MAETSTRFVRTPEPRTLPPMSRTISSPAQLGPFEEREDAMNTHDVDDGRRFVEPSSSSSRRSIAVVREQPSSRFRPEAGSRGAAFAAVGEQVSRRGPLQGEQRSRRGLSAAEPGSRVFAGQVLVGEVLSKNYDLTAVDAEDTSSVMATIHCIVTLEDRVPDLDITVNREPGYYAILVRGFDEFIDIVNWHNKVREA